MTRDEYVQGWKVAILGTVCVLLLLLVAGGGCAGYKTFHRVQKRADANNAVKVTTINIRKAQQQARIVAAQDATVKAKADQRLIEAKGIRAAQDEISATLTDRYLQHEAIKAQMEMANSPNHSTIYVPAGNNGVPLVRDTSADGK